MKILITGARGFIGSQFLNYMLQSDDDQRIDDREYVAFYRDTNSWSQARLLPPHSTVGDHDNVAFAKGDLTTDISGLCEGVDVVFNFAAKTFVDHSIVDPTAFVDTNVVGTMRLLEEARRQKVKAFFQVSTDEVYGQILDGYHNEKSPLCPRNPYAASKAGADALVLSYAHTFDMFTCVTRTENNYGIMQHSQKVVPTFVAKAAKGEPLPVYGDGQHIRQWLHVADHCSALRMLMQTGWAGKRIPNGEVYHVAGKQELTNLALAEMILGILGKGPAQIEFIADHDIRPGHDKRYALTCQKIHDAVQWTPSVPLDDGMGNVVRWYAANERWHAAENL